MLLSCLGSRNGSRKGSTDSGGGKLIGGGGNVKDVNGTINRRMKQFKKEHDRTYRLLLLGSGESGKSTIVKQMQILHKQGFSNEERRRKLVDIHRNVLDAISSILRAMREQFEPSGELEDESKQPLATYVLDASQDINFDFTPDFCSKIKQLWADGGVQAAFRRSNEYQLIDCAKYFLDKIDELGRPDYVPDDQDILRCRTQTKGIHQVKFVVDKVNFHMFDVGGQRYERRRWCQCFHGITAILFVSAMSDYNLTLAEDTQHNRLRESLQLFDEVWKNRFLQGVSVILFLNKQDILEDKISSGTAPLEDYFSEYVHYKARPSAKDRFDNDTAETIRAKLFIRELFLASKFQQRPSGSVVAASANNYSHEHNLLSTYSSTAADRRRSGQSLVVAGGNPAESSNRRKCVSQGTISGSASLSPMHPRCSISGGPGATNQSRQCYAHFTCAVDTQNIQRIFNDVKNTIQIINLKNYELI